MKSIRNSQGLYWGLIIAFFSLYMLVGFVSTLHSITFFQLANAGWMAVMLGITYELGQAAVLFSILMSDNNKKMLPWALMFLLTALQVTANVYASFKFMDASESIDWTYWQRSILFWMETDDPEMFKVIISWITGALLPIVALGMTALVAENLKLKDEYVEKGENLSIGADSSMDDSYGTTSGPFGKGQEADLQDSDEELPEIKKEKSEILAEDLLSKPNIESNPIIKEEVPNFGIEEKMEVPKIDKSLFRTDSHGISENQIFDKKPINNQRGWHLKKEFIDDNGDVYRFGLRQEGKKGTPPKKA